MQFQNFLENTKLKKENKNIKNHNEDPHEKILQNIFPQSRNCDIIITSKILREKKSPFKEKKSNKSIQIKML